MASNRLTQETKFSIMGKMTLEALELYCPGCGKTFYYVNYENDELQAKFCTECGRKNANATH